MDFFLWLCEVFGSLYIVLNPGLALVDAAHDLSTIHPRPVLIIHGLDDELFPPYHAEQMYEAAQEPKELWLIERLGHGNPVDGREAEFKARVVSFFEEAFAEERE